jgi:hypothetical protein
MGTKMLQVEISDTLYDRLHRVAPDPSMLWRNRHEPAYRAIERAVEVALKRFLDDLESRARARATKDSNTR